MSNTRQYNVYLLVHTYEYAENEEIKILGIYSSKNKAKDAIERYFALDGFKNFSKDCFEIQKYSLNTDSQWNEGFVSSEIIENDFKKLTICINKWLGVNKTPEESWKEEEFYNAVCDINSKVHNTSNEIELAKFIQQIWYSRFNENKKVFDEYVTLANKIKEILE